GVMARIESLSDDDFLGRAPALRDGFEVLSTAGRRRLLLAIADRLGADDGRGQGLDVATDIPPEVMVLAAEADRAGRDAIAAVSREDVIYGMNVHSANVSSMTGEHVYGMNVHSVNHS